MSLYRTKDIRSVARVFDVRPEDVLAFVRLHNSLGDLTLVPEGGSQRAAMADRIFLDASSIDKPGSYANSILSDTGIAMVRSHFEAAVKLNFSAAWDEAHGVSV